MKVTEPLLLSGTVRLASKNGLWFVNKFKFDYSNESETMDNRKTSLSIIHSETQEFIPRLEVNSPFAHLPQ